MLIEKTADTTISHTDIDHDHDVFIQLVNEMEQADDGTFVKLFAQLTEHTQAHFDRENQLMDEYGFFAITEHKGEHHRVLAEFLQFKKRVDKGLIDFGRAYIKERLPQWFNLHVTTMDRALDAHIKKQQLK